MSVSVCGCTGMRFRVHVKETENLSVSGPADLVLSEEGIALHSVHTGRPHTHPPLHLIPTHPPNIQPPPPPNTHTLHIHLSSTRKPSQ